VSGLNMRTAGFRASISFLSPDSGGRLTMPEGDGYAPYLRTDSLDGGLAVRIIGIPEGASFASLLSVEVELTYHRFLSYGELQLGQGFYLTEGSKRVAEGVIESLLRY